VKTKLYNHLKLENLNLSHRIYIYICVCVCVYAYRRYHVHTVHVAIKTVAYIIFAWYSWCEYSVKWKPPFCLECFKWTLENTLILCRFTFRLQSFEITRSMYVYISNICQLNTENVFEMIRKSHRHACIQYPIL